MRRDWFGMHLDEGCGEANQRYIWMREIGRDQMLVSRDWFDIQTSG